MKHYQRIYEDLFRDRKSFHSAKIDAVTGTLSDLSKQFDTFFTDAYRQMFYLSICFLWLEKQLIFNGHRRIRRFRGGHAHDLLYSRFITQIVGRDHLTFSRNRSFQIAAAVASELFPEFFEHNPFEEPEYYQWPYHHAGLDFMAYIYQVHNRFELLAYAEERHMSFHDFKNWVNNYVLCYNEEQGKEIYQISLTAVGAIYIKRYDFKPYIAHDSLHNLLKHESKKTEAGDNDIKQTPT